jgi:putative CocE/NonD family hydrolase
MSALARIVLLVVVALLPRVVGAQDFDFDPPATATDPALPAALRDLAERVLPVYQENHPDRYLANLAALQMAVGDPAAARATRASLRERLQSEQGTAAGQPIVYDIYTQARALEATEQIPFETAYAQAFRETLDSLDDLAAYDLEDWFVEPIEPLQEMLQRALDARRGKTSIDLEEALDLVRAWFGFDAYRSFGGLVRPLLAEDRDKRYVIDDDVAIPVAKDATIAATLIRPRATAKTANVADAADAATLPTLLEFTLDKSSRDPRETAAHGYASVLVLPRIAGDPNVRPHAPFEADGDDARAVIAWIAKQPWSDGRVGMQGEGYGGFVAWSAAKRRPAALQAIATSDPMAPGIDVPMANGIFSNSAYRWVYDLLETPEAVAANDADRWRSLDEEWFRSGGWYRGFPSLPGPASAVFRSWLNHPSYDRFWQKWLPFGDEFSHIGIPVLTITGYYSGGETASLYYFTEHHRHDANADHTLLIGPFGERTDEQGTASSVRGLSLDPVAQIDPDAVRYEWFDAVLKGGKRPELLAGTVNYQLEGANEWRHEPSLEALETKPRRFYLRPSASGAAPYALVMQKPAPMSLTQTLDLGERTEIRWGPTDDLVLKNLEPLEGALFMTEAFAEPTGLAGRLRGVLDFTINKYDVDLVVSLYELRSNGDYVKLFDPAYAFRASYARDRVHRHLLKAGVRQQLPFQSPRMVGRTLAAGSRLVLTLGINKRADQQINYGTTGEVSEDSIDVAGAPVRIRWHEGTFIEIASP